MKKNKCKECNNLGIKRCTNCDYSLCNKCFDNGKGYICWSDTKLCGKCDNRSNDPYYPN
jgi:hypothetical protein